jgi:hypothetical protein
MYICFTVISDIPREFGANESLIVYAFLYSILALCYFSKVYTAPLCFSVQYLDNFRSLDKISKNMKKILNIQPKVELETTTRRNLPFFGTVISNLKRKGSLRSLAVNNVQHARVSLIHKVLIIIEHHSGCLLVGIGTPPPQPPLPQASVPPPPDQRVGGRAYSPAA